MRLVAALGAAALLGAAPAGEPRYLIFQLFTYGPNPQGTTQPFDSAGIRRQVDEILAAVGGHRGDGRTRQLGFAVGPLSLDHTDAELRTTIRESFRIAEEKNVALAIHIDDSMFWLRRKDLWSDPENVEWSDWQRTVVPHRYVGWLPIALAPQMCYASPKLRREIRRIATGVIGAEIERGIDHLRARHLERLFAGVIAGWESNLWDYRYVPANETKIDRLGIPRVRMGYCSLSHLGYSAANPPPDMDAALERVVHDWASYWAASLERAGIPPTRIYTHIAFVTVANDQQQQMLAQLSRNLGFTARLLGFLHTDAGTAFNEHSRPGFSTYPSGFKENDVDGVLARIMSARALHGDPPWASVEGSNTDGSHAPEVHSELTWNEYLFGMFDHGASLVDLFGWPEPADGPTPYGRAIRSSDAVAAYRAFLGGEGKL